MATRVGERLKRLAVRQILQFLATRLRRFPCKSPPRWIAKFLIVVRTIASERAQPDGPEDGIEKMSTQQKVFLTAADGAALCVLTELLSRGIEVTVLSPKPLEVHGCRAIVGGLDSADHFVNEISSADGILHLARSDSPEPDAVLRENIMGTASLLDAWRTGPFVYLSSLRICQWPTRRSQLPAQFVLSVHPAQRSNELQLRLASTHPPRTAAVILRRGFLISSDRSSFIGFVCRLCQQGATFVFESEGALEQCGCSFIGGKDLGRAVADALTIRSSGKYYVAGGFCTWRSLIDTVNKHAATKAKFLVRKGGPSEANEIGLPQSRAFLDTSSFNAGTGFVPKQSFEEQIEEFVRADQTAAAKSA